MRGGARITDGWDTQNACAVARGSLM
eukprot:COSAG02_NODE_54210_length_297_cov_0.994949_2_plen_26_part_01